MQAASDNSSVANIKPVGITLISLASVHVCVMLLGLGVTTMQPIDVQDVDAGWHAASTARNSGINAAYNVLILCGAVSIVRRTSYLWAFASCCFAIVPLCSPCYVLGIPVGIWGIVLLRKPAVRDSFQYM